MVDVNCETDFVAKADDFVKFVGSITTTLLTAPVSTDEELLAMQLADGQTVEELRRSLIAKLGENIAVRRFQNINHQPVELPVTCMVAKSA